MAKIIQNFQAETKELLDLMIHSLYSHREIFLRELVSNASDAIEKLKFEILTNSSLAQTATSDFEVRLESNTQNRTLTIKDNGIGMTKDEVVKNIGTIAHSGTKSFLNLRKEINNNPELIGQFGVGFYSAFMVADRVTMNTQKAGSNEGVFWESEGAGTYSIDDRPRPEGNGTTITLHLKEFKDDENVQDFTDAWVLRELIKKYSDFVAYPIRMKVSREQKSENGTSETVVEDETLNSQKAVWLKPSSEVSDEEYKEFYRHVSHDWTDPLKTIHYKAEGAMEFTSLLYIPSQKPMDYDYRERKTGLNLYVKRVFIKGDCEELIPSYLRFVKGVVDSEDLSLNVSREILQQDRQIERIKKALTGKILSSLKELLEKDRNSYEKFWRNFGTTLKEGIALESGVNDKLQDLLLFNSTASTDLVSLKEYTSKMKPEQKAIYYITGESLGQIKNSPYLERLKAKEYDVLLMDDRVDAWIAGGLKNYEDKPFQSITAEDLDLSTESEKQEKEEKRKDVEGKFKMLLEIMKNSLKDQVKDIKVSERLTESPVCLVSSQNATTAHMERVLEQMGQSIPKTKRVLEINPDHPLFDKMIAAPKAQQEQWASILYQQALLNEGSPIENPLKYSQQIAQLMIQASQGIA